jgi:hypothetical protein
MSTPDYIQYPIETNPQDLLDEVISYLQSKVPSWQPQDGALDTWIVQIMTSQVADLRTLALDVPDTIFQWFGSTLLNIPPIDATPARAQSTWTVQDGSGYTIPDSTYVTIRDSAGNDVPFQTDGDVLIPPGSTATADGGVYLIAVNAGADGSGLGSVGGPVTLLDTLAFVTGVVQTDITTGGVDAETSTDYNNRLAHHLHLLSTRPILPDDFANLALETVGVYRAIAIDGFNPADSSTGNARMIAVSAIDINGNNLDGATKSALQATLQANREVNFIVNVIDPNRTAVDVTFAAISVLNYDPAQVQADAIAAVQNYLSPATWGQAPFVDNPQTWVQIDKVYYFEMVQAISNVQGVDRLVSLTMAVHGGTLASSDVALVTPATLAEAGTINGTVTSS